MSNLLALARKAPVVSTFSAQTLAVSSVEVNETYCWHAATYVEQPDLARLRAAFVEAVQQAKTPKACLIAPFGYGKTASAIGLWNACRQAGLLVVPPISCGSFAELAGAIYSWLTFILPETASELTEAHDKFLVSSPETLARHDERRFGIPFDQALESIRDKIERGYLDFEDVSINLLAFLEQSTHLAQRAGYHGLVVIIDEFQQFLGNANKGILVALRQFIWGLRTRQLSFGLLFTMDPDTERTLADRAGDILHRIKDDGLYLDIRHIYNRDFPAQLWQQYTTALRFTETDQQVIDRPTLDALGQLCERDDLSNGPRTVINVLQRATARYITDASSSYTPIDLIDDLVSGSIRFDGDRGVIPALVAELLNFPYFQRSTDRAKALKLIAAFPRGCPEHIAGFYRLTDAWHELDDDLRGEILTATDEGLALIELQRVGQPANRLNVLLRRYWMQITDEQLFAEDATRVFASLILPLLFPAKVHDLNGWTGTTDVQLAAAGGYTGILVGTSSSRYPLRRIAVTITSDSTTVPVIRDEDDVDFNLIFCLNFDPDAVSAIMLNPTYDQIIFNLAIRHPAEARLRGGIAWIEHYLSPHPISVAVILSLLRYLEREHGDSLPERDQARIEDTLARLREWLLTELLPPALFEAAGLQVAQAGGGALKECLYLLCSRRWPHYQPLARYPNWAALMRDYEAALTRIAPGAKVNETSVTLSKAEIATLFNQKRHAGFESRARQYGSLLHLETWKGSAASVRFVPHPAEVELADQIRNQGEMPERAASTYLRTVGFAASESEQLVRLAVMRGLVCQVGDRLTVPPAPTDIEIHTHAQRLKARITSLSGVPDELSSELDAIINAEGRSADPSATMWQLDRMDRQIQEIEVRVTKEATAHRKATRTHLINRLPRLTGRLDNPGSGRIEKHLAALHDLLEQERQQLQQAAERLMAMPEEQFSPDEAGALLTRIEAWSAQAELYVRWHRLDQRTHQIHTSVERLSSGGGALKELELRIADLEREERAVLAGMGRSGLAEVGRLEADLVDLEQQFQSMEDVRRGAYTQVGTDLVSDVCALIGLASPLSIPPYDPTNDERSFQALFQTVALVLRRYIMLMGLAVTGDSSTAGEKRTWVKLQADMQAMARNVLDRQWLIHGTPPQLRPGAVQAIRQLRERVTTYERATTATTSHLLGALSTLPTGPTDIAVLFEQVDSAVPHDETLRELIKLHKAGFLRMTIDLPDTEAS